MGKSASLDFWTFFFYISKNQEGNVDISGRKVDLLAHSIKPDGVRLRQLCERERESRPSSRPIPMDAQEDTDLSPLRAHFP